MTPTEELKHEHKVILLVLEGAEKQVASPGRTDRASLTEMVDFFINFVDRCHHAKEEKHLFPKLEEHGIPRHGGPIGVMLDEHTQGRSLVAAMKEALSQSQGEGDHVSADAEKNLLRYVQLLRSHIDKENNVLFVMADRALSAEEQQDLSKAFAKVEAEEIGEGVHEKYHQLAHRLAGV
jgi:hemerythrin-like domain-containing protein